MIVPNTTTITSETSIIFLLKKCAVDPRPFDFEDIAPPTDPIASAVPKKRRQAGGVWGQSPQSTQTCLRNY